MVPKLPPLYSQKTFSSSLANAMFENVVFLCSTFISHLNWNAQPPNNQTSEQWKNYLTFEGFFTYLIIWQIFHYLQDYYFLANLFICSQICSLDCTEKIGLHLIIFHTLKLLLIGDWSVEIIEDLGSPLVWVNEGKGILSNKKNFTSRRETNNIFG